MPCVTSGGYYGEAREVMGFGSSPAISTGHFMPHGPPSGVNFGETHFYAVG